MLEVNFVCVFGLIPLVLTVNKSSRVTDVSDSLPESVPPVMYRSNEDDRDIPAGRLAFPAEYPYVVHLAIENAETRQKTQCGGSIINRVLVLTACHCLASLPVHQPPRGVLSRVVWITAGIIETNDNELHEAQIRKAYSHLNEVHPRCMRLDGDFIAFDVGVVHTPEHDPFQFYSHIRPTSLYSSNDFILGEEQNRVKKRQQICSLVSWEFNERLGLKSARRGEKLSVAQMRVLPDASCSDYFCSNSSVVNEMWCPLSETKQYPKICAKKITRLMDCPPRSGGVLICDDMVFGVTSWNPNCSSRIPLVFASVQTALRWMRDARVKVVDEKSTSQRLLASENIVVLFCFIWLSGP